MSAALEQGGTSFDALYVDVNGQSGYFDRTLEVYGRGGRALPPVRDAHPPRAVHEPLVLLLPEAASPGRAADGGSPSDTAHVTDVVEQGRPDRGPRLPAWARRTALAAALVAAAAVVIPRLGSGADPSPPDRGTQVTAGTRQSPYVVIGDGRQVVRYDTFGVAPGPELPASADAPGTSACSSPPTPMVRTGSSP